MSEQTSLRSRHCGATDVDLIVLGLDAPAVYTRLCGGRVRQVLSAGNSGTVVKRRPQLRGPTFTVNLNLVFLEGNSAVAIGDVTYKLVSCEWRRAGLCQAVAFAEP